MFRVLLLAAVLFPMTSGAHAQSDPVKERNALMYEMGEHAYGAFNKIVRGEQPYDQAKVDAGLAKIADNSRKLSGLWPAGTDRQAEGGDFRSSPKVWANKADFDARLAKLQEQAALHASGKVKNLDDLKAAFDLLVRQQCNSCHQEYRLRSQQ